MFPAFDSVPEPQSSAVDNAVLERGGVAGSVARALVIEHIRLDDSNPELDDQCKDIVCVLCAGRGRTISYIQHAPECPAWDWPLTESHEAAAARQHQNSAFPLAPVAEGSAR
jgi:hypothetical protein